MNNQEILTSIKTKTIYDEIVKDKLLEMDSDGDGITEKALRDDRGRVISDAYELKKEKLDFLLVDAWQGLEGNYEPTTLGYDSVMVTTIDSVCRLYSRIEIDWVIIAGTETDVPISQTTIFVHPVTFERYRFNGTTMEVYDDVDDITPRLLELVCNISAAYDEGISDYIPSIKILNGDSSNLLKGITTYNINDNVLILQGNLIDYRLIQSSLVTPFVDSSKLDFIRIDNNNNNYISFWFTTNLQVQNFNLEIKQRLRGAPPKLLSAETNTAGDKITLTFDKAMSDYGIMDKIVDNDAIQFLIEENGISITSVESINKEIIFTIDGLINHVDSGLSISINSGAIESLDFGLYPKSQEITTVTNNVPQPPFQLVSANINESGSLLTLEFNEDIAEIVFSVWIQYDENAEPILGTEYQTPLLTLYLSSGTELISVLPVVAPMDANTAVIGNVITYGFGQGLNIYSGLTVTLSQNCNWNSGMGTVLSATNQPMVEITDFPVTNNIM